MKTSLLARLALVLFPLTLWAAPPPRTIVVDVQRPLQTFSIRVAAGTTPLLRATVQNGGANYNTTGWTGVLFYARTKDSTQAVAIASTATGTNYVEFLVPAAKLASTGGAYFAQLVLAESGGPAVEWSRGQLTIDASPGTYGAALTNFSPTLNWDLIGTYLGTPPWTLETNGLTAAQAGQIATNVVGSVGSASSNFVLTVAAGISNNLRSVSNLAVAALASSVWATARSTTNFTARSGDTMTGALSGPGFVITNNLYGTGSSAYRQSVSNWSGSPVFGLIRAAGDVFQGMRITGDPSESDGQVTGGVEIGPVRTPSDVLWGAYVRTYNFVGADPNAWSSATNVAVSIGYFPFAGNSVPIEVLRITTNSISGHPAYRFEGNGSGLTNLSGVVTISAYQADLTNNVRIVVTNSPTVGVLNILKTMGDGTAWWGAP